MTGHSNMKAIKRADLHGITFYQVPKWSMDLFLEKKLTPGAFATYILMYNRLRMSEMNNWVDKNGDVYIRYTWENLKKDLKVKSMQQIKRNLDCLFDLNLLEKKKSFSQSNVYYLNVYKGDDDILQNVESSILQNVEDDILQNVEPNNNNLNNKTLDISTMDKSEFKIYCEKVAEVTNVPLIRVEMCIQSGDLKNYVISELLEEIEGSEFLSGKANKKPTIKHFSISKQLDKIIGGFYKDDKKTDKGNKTATLTTEDTLKRYKAMSNKGKNEEYEILDI